MAEESFKIDLIQKSFQTDRSRKLIKIYLCQKRFKIISSRKLNEFGLGRKTL